MEKSEILNILTDWNFWRRDVESGITREEPLKKIKTLSETNEIIVIKGIRRSGKSTLLLQLCADLIRSGTRKEDILIVNFEDPRFKGLNLDLLNKIYEIYLTELDPKENHYVILDEVQSVNGWEKFARYLHENKKVHVFITGSSSKLLSSEYSTVLSGRHMDIEVYPLSFKEYLLFVGLETKTPVDISAKRHRIKKAFHDYLALGGFPKVTLVNEKDAKIELLSTYFRDIVIKDIVLRHKIKEIEKLEDLAKYYLTNISTLQSFNKIKNILKLNLDTVERFSGYLSDVYLLSFVRKFSYSKNEQILNPRKVYCSDTGLRNSVGFVFSEDFGRLAENIVFNELNRKGLEIYYWKSKYETDFISKRGKKIQEAIQVCWNIGNPETKERELRGLVEACKETNLKKGLIITEDLEKEEVVEGVKIKYIPLWKWLLEKK